MNEKVYSAYDIALEALKMAHVRLYGTDDVDDLLNAADQIHNWLVKKGELVTESVQDADRYVYFADEERNASGNFPDYTYWYRFDKTTGETRRVEDDGTIKTPAFLKGTTLDYLRSQVWLTEVAMHEVPEGAR